MNLFVLPDELWISILHEWISKPITLCAFDVALCNRLLRERYLIWLYEKTRGTFNVFSHIHFETTLEHSKHGMLHQDVPDSFFDWCKRRQINPKSLSYYFEQTNEQGKWEWKISKEAFKVMKQVEQLNVYYRLDCDMTNTDFLSNILNDCPQLKKLIVGLPDVNQYHFSNTLTFSCKNGPYPLMDVEFNRARFHLFSDSFHDFVDACPNLEKVKLEDCQGIHLYDILYLLNHANALNSVNVNFCSNSCRYSLLDIAHMSQMVEKIMTNNRINKSIKTLILKGLGSRDDVSILIYLISIFKKCPMLEKVVVDFLFVPQDLFSVVAWCEMISNNWQHLQSLTLQYAAWMINNELIMNSLESCCGKGLKELSIVGEVTNELIARICQSFVALESLELLFDHNTSIQYPAMLQSFQQARFRNTLHTFKVPRGGGGGGRFDISTNEKPFDYSDILNCFPALHNIDLVTTAALHVVEPFASIPQVKECTFRFLALMCPEMMMRDFINLKKLTLHNLALNNTALSSILTLPQLEHLSFHNVCEVEGIRYYSVLHPNQYPSFQLAPLKEFSYVVGYYNIKLPPEFIRTFLQRFVSLERLIIRNQAMEVGELLELRQEFRYRTMISLQ